jgi:putative DNA primase/helicase
MSAAVRAAALAAYNAGLAVYPPREDGSKQPDTYAWKQWQAERPPWTLLTALYARTPPRTGLGSLTGRVSGNLEVLEFDCGNTYRTYCALADETGLGALVARIRSGYEEATPSGGVHWPYRCAAIAGNTKLARRAKRPEEMEGPHDKVKVLIETRGEGGYIVLAPSYGGVHPTQRAYQLRRGAFATIATITPPEREALHELARTFDQMPRARVRLARSAGAARPAGARPGDQFAAAVSWADILEPHGWAPVYQWGGVTRWRRPGKDRGASATTNYAGSDLLYVFSSATLFEPERGYGKFAAYALLNHGGDYQAAARALVAQGYAGPAALTLRPDGRRVRRLPAVAPTAGVRLPALRRSA